MGNLIDLTGKRFGKLMVIRRAGSDKSGKALWNTTCDCGATNHIVSGDVLARGSSHSCGCGKSNIGLAKRKDISGTRFGKLVAIRLDRIVKYRSFWLCKCDCGNMKTICLSHLTSGDTISCGCVRDSLLKTHGLSRTKEYRRARFAARRELDSKWTTEMEIELSRFFLSCVVCGGTDRLATDHVYPLDRGYGLMPGNAVKLCKSHNSYKHNKMPSDLPKDVGDKILASAYKFKEHWEAINE